MWFAIAAASVKKQTISFKQSIKLSIKKFFPLVCLIILVGPISLIGLVLLIIPGVIIIARASLAILVMFTENVGPIKALKRSFALTKGRTIEMIGSFFAGYLFSGGFLLAPAVTVAPFVGRYEDIRCTRGTSYFYLHVF
jgi:uncharacterized membrane protein